MRFPTLNPFTKKKNSSQPTGLQKKPSNLIPPNLQRVSSVTPGKIVNEYLEKHVLFYKKSEPKTDLFHKNPNRREDIPTNIPKPPQTFIPKKKSISESKIPKAPLNTTSKIQECNSDQSSEKVSRPKSLAFSEISPPPTTVSTASKIPESAGIKMEAPKKVFDKFINEQAIAQTFNGRNPLYYNLYNMALISASQAISADLLLDPLPSPTNNITLATKITLGVSGGLSCIEIFKRLCQINKNFLGKYYLNIIYRSHEKSLTQQDFEEAKKYGGYITRKTIKGEVRYQYADQIKIMEQLCKFDKLEVKLQQKLDKNPFDRNIRNYLKFIQVKKAELEELNFLQIAMRCNKHKAEKAIEKIFTNIVTAIAAFGTMSIANCFLGFYQAGHSAENTLNFWTAIKQALRNSHDRAVDKKFVTFIKGIHKAYYPNDDFSSQNPALLEAIVRAKRGEFSVAEAKDTSWVPKTVENSEYINKIINQSLLNLPNNPDDFNEELIANAYSAAEESHQKRRFRPDKYFNKNKSTTKKDDRYERAAKTFIKNFNDFIGDDCHRQRILLEVTNKNYRPPVNFKNESASHEALEKFQIYTQYKLMESILCASSNDDHQTIKLVREKIRNYIAVKHIKTFPNAASTLLNDSNLLSLKDASTKFVDEIKELLKER